MKRVFVFLATALALVACQNSQNGQYQSYTDTIELNGLKFFYAAEGAGKPVILIHGNGESHSYLETTQRQLAQAGYMVYALDSRGQGANEPVAEYHYKDMANDILAFIKAKGLDRPAVFGYSDGGIIALELESMHPGTCSLIAVSGANITADNAFDPQLSVELFGTRHNIDSMPPLVRMMALEPNMTKADLERITVPALVCAGENDLIYRHHTELIDSLLPNSELCIVPNADHGSHIYHDPRMGTILLDFFRRNNY